MKLFRQSSRVIAKLNTILDLVLQVPKILPRLMAIQEALGRIESRQTAAQESMLLHEQEFQTFSKSTVDGILQFLTRHIPVPKKIFIELNTENYYESNTCFLLKNNQWAGLYLNPNQAAVDEIQQDDMYWRYNLKTKCVVANRSNINKIFIDKGLEDEIGLLAVDMHGQDFWIWEAIHMVHPAIVVVGYNARFGPDKAMVVEYDAHGKPAHASKLYFGASLKALYLLGQRKGYDLVGCNRAGTHAFFVQKSLRPEHIPALTPEEAYQQGTLKDYRFSKGKRHYMEEEKEENLLAEMPWVNVEQYELTV